MSEVDVDVVAEPAVENVDVSPTQSDDVSKEARTFGWVPKEEFRGNEDAWVDAETFVRRGKEINPILRKNNEVLYKKLQEKDMEIAEIRKIVNEFKKFHQDTESRAYDRALHELKIQKKDALQEGDAERVMQLDDVIDELKTKKPVVATTVETPQVDPAFSAWVAENDWYTDNKKMNRVANAYGETLRLEGSRLMGKEFLEEVKSRLMEDFPKEFNITPRKVNNPVEGASSGSSGGRKKTSKDLPEDARKSMAQFVKQGLLTEEQYIKDYFA